MGAEYQFRFKDSTGDVYVVLAAGDGILRSPVNYAHFENSPGKASLNIWGGADLVTDIQVDDQLEIWRRWFDPGGDMNRNVDWYLEWEGFYRSPERRQTNRGDRSVKLEFMGYLDLARRTGIAYRKTDARATKNAPVETVMKEFVSENCGPDATNPPRLYANVLPGLSVEADAGGGPNWQGERAYKNLLKVLQEIAKSNDWYFDIIGVGDDLYEFQTYEDFRGHDRALPVNPATGLNAAGYLPVVFSTEAGNMQNPVYAVNRNEEVGICYVLGDATPPRTITIRENVDSIGQSRFNHWEFFKNAQDAAAGDLAAIGDAVLEDRRFQEIFTFQVLQTAELIYGRDYFFGDQVTAQFEEIERNKKITSVTVQVTEREEEIDIGVQDVQQVNRTTPVGKLVEAVNLLQKQVEGLEALE